MRIIAFGDSWTAGHGVETDVKYKEDANPIEGKGFYIDLRRQNSWPRWLSDKFNCLYLNRGYSGSGNHDILNEIKIIMDENLFDKETDVIIVMFSYPHRYRTKKPENDPITIFESIEKILEGYKHFYFNSFYPTFKDEDFDVTQLPSYFINPTECISDYLRKYEIKNDVGVWEYGSRSVWNDMKGLHEGDYHPNLFGYKLIGDFIYNMIKDKL